MVSLHLGKSKTKMFLIHRLVALAFIPNTEQKKQINHIDKNKQNNFSANLEWVTPKENMAHHYATGGIKNNNQTYKGKFGAEHNRSMKITCNGIIYNGISEASRITGIPLSSIHYSVSRGKTLKNGFSFQKV